MKIPATNLWHWDGVDDRLELQFNNPAEIQALIEKSLKTRGGYLSFVIDLPKRPRSTGHGSASNHFHGHCQQLTMILGVSFDEVKTYIKIRAALEMGYPAKMLGGIAIPQSEALASVEEENMLIEMAHIVASERGYVLREADE